MASTPPPQIPLVISRSLGADKPQREIWWIQSIWWNVNFVAGGDNTIHSLTTSLANDTWSRWGGVGRVHGSTVDNIREQLFDIFKHVRK